MGENTEYISTKKIISLLDEDIDNLSDIKNIIVLYEMKEIDIPKEEFLRITNDYIPYQLYNIHKFKNNLEENVPYNKDLNNITNYFIKKLGINEDKCWGRLLFAVSIILIILPVLWKIPDSNIFPLITIIGGTIVLTIMYFLYLQNKNNYSEFNSGDYYCKILKDRQKVQFLKKEGLVDDLIDYLRKGDEEVSKIMLKILAISLMIYRYYKENCIINNDLYRIPYIVVLTALAILGVQYLSNSPARLKLLNVLEHFKVENLESKNSN